MNQAELAAAKKAILLYRKERITRRGVHTAIKAYTEGKASKRFKTLISRITRREKLTVSLPFPKEAADLGNFTVENVKGAREIYTRLSKRIDRKDVEKLIIANRDKIDRGLVYTILPINAHGEPIGKFVLRGVPPETAGQWMDSIKAKADAGTLPFLSPTSTESEELWGQIPARARVKMDLSYAEKGGANRELRGFKVGITFARPW